MKKTLLVAALTTVLIAPSVFAVSLENEDQQLSYSFGLMIAKQMKPSFEKLDLEVFSAALKDVYTGNDQQLSQEKVEAALQKFQQKQIELQKLATAKAAVTAKSEADVKAKVSIEQGAKFLAENAKREGVTRLESGLQIEITHPGTGNKPTLSDTVVVHYAGKTLEGVEFDSSIKREKPATFPLDAVIPGWTEGLQLLKEGAKAKLYIPSKLAYGNQGAGPQIGPGETLIFEVELIEIVKKDAKK